MRRNRLAVAFLSACLIVSSVTSGCGKGKSANPISGAKLESGDITENSTVILVGDTGIKYSEVRNYCYLLKKQYNPSFGDGIWKYSIGEDYTIGDEAKQEVINMITQLNVIKSVAKEQEITLTADENTDAVQFAEKLVEAASDEDKEKYCLSVQNITELYADNILANKMFYIATDDVDTEVPDDVARQIDVQYIQIITNGTDRNGVAIDMDDKTKREAEKRAKAIRKKAKEAESFKDFAQENTDSSQNELTIGKDSRELPDNVIDKALTMKKGSISEVLEGTADDGTQGYYIVYCVNDNNEDATYNRKEEIIAENQMDMFKTKYSEWLKDCNVNISQKFWENFSI